MKNRIKRGFGLVVLVAGLTALLSPVALASDDMAKVYVVHGIPGSDLGLDPALPVDVLVDDALCLLDGFSFGDVAGAVELPEGTYNIKIGLADEDQPCSQGPVIEADVPFVSGETASVVAHLTADGAPTASKFSHDLSFARAGRARVSVQHTAAAPAVDLLLARNNSPFSPRVVVGDFVNGDQAEAVVRPGRWNVSIGPAGTPVVVFGPAAVRFKPFRGYLVWAVGSVESGSFT